MFLTCGRIELRTPRIGTPPFRLAWGSIRPSAIAVKIKIHQQQHGYRSRNIAVREQEENNNVFPRRVCQHRVGALPEGEDQAKQLDQPDPRMRDAPKPGSTEGRMLEVVDQEISVRRNPIHSILR
jgi:hypothetical protein